MTFSEAFHSRRILFPALVYGVVSLACTQFALLNYLGYEFSALVALIGSIISGIVTIRAIKDAHGVSPEGVMQAFGGALFLNIALLIIPLAVMTTNALFVKNCSLLEGVGYFIVLPVCSVIFSASSGFFCAVHYRFAKTMFFLFVTVTFLYTLALGYFTPAVYSYNFFYGYFPGITYDETLGIGWSLIFFRMLTLVLAAIFIWWSVILLRTTTAEDSVFKKGKTLFLALSSRRYALLSVLLIVFLASVYAFKGKLGFESHESYIRSELGKKFTTEHFVIYYSATSYDSTEIRWIGADHEFRRQQILSAFNISSSQMIESYIYPSSTVKQRLIGTGNTNIAKPWSGQIHITKQSLDGTLKHELVHVLAAPFGMPLIHANLSTGLVEGLAVAIEWDWGNRTPHQYAAAMRKYKLAPPIGSLMSLAGFASQASSISYVLAGSFCRYLIDRYGIRKFVLLYGGETYIDVYGRNLAQLIAEWNAFLDRVEVTDRDQDAVEVLFRQPPIFKKFCARVLAERNKQARTAYAKGDYGEAAALYQQSYEEGRGYEALAGYLASALRLDEYGIVTAVLDSIILQDFHPRRYLPIYLTIGDAFWGAGNVRRAGELYATIEFADFSLGYSEAAHARAQAIRDSAVQPALRHYFLDGWNDTLRLALLDSIDAPDDAIVQYLKGVSLIQFAMYDSARTALQSVSFLPHDRYLEALRLRRLGYCLFRLKRFQDARISFWLSLNYLSTQVAVNEVNDWVERCEWMGERFEQ